MIAVIIPAKSARKAQFIPFLLQYTAIELLPRIYGK